MFIISFSKPKVPFHRLMLTAAFNFYEPPPICFWNSFFFRSRGLSLDRLGILANYVHIQHHHYWGTNIIIIGVLRIGSRPLCILDHHYSAPELHPQPIMFSSSISLWTRLPMKLTLCVAEVGFEPENLLSARVTGVWHGT